MGQMAFKTWPSPANNAGLYQGCWLRTERMIIDTLILNCLPGECRHGY